MAAHYSEVVHTAQNVIPKWGCVVVSTKTSQNYQTNIN